MKAIYTIIIAIVATLGTTTKCCGSTLNGGTNPAAGTSTTLCTSATNEAAMSSEMEAALMMAINNQTATTRTTTTFCGSTDNAVKMTVSTSNETIVTNSFATHRFTENTTSNDIAPAAVATETIELEAEGL